MKTTFFTLVFFLSLGCSCLSAQPYQHLLRDDRHWTYTQMAYEDVPMHIMAAFALSMQRDTLLQGNFYKKIYRRGLRLNEFATAILYPREVLGTSLYALMREDTLARKVYFLPLQDTAFLCAGTEHLLYDFSLQVGDTLNACVLKNLAAPFLNYVPRVDSIRQENYYGYPSRAFYTKGVFINEGLLADVPGALLEGFGYGVHGLIYFGWMRPTVLLVSYCEGTTADCYLVSAAQEPPALPASAIAVSPNPAQELVTIQLPPTFQKETEFDISLSNAAGKVVRQVTGNSTDALEINVSDLPNGVYFLKIDGRKWNAAAKIVVAH